MIRYLLDTDFCVHALRKRTPAVARMLREHATEAALSDITAYELFYGAASYDAPETRLHIIEDFISRFQILPFNTEAARHAGVIRAELEAQGKMIGNLDILIGAIARAEGLTLLTGNVREFSRIKGLHTKSWRT
ncbi:PIN domain-containing protein [Aestuariivirga litoralis]|uniref:PIN domain-containing protein n=1 Tax=Aestuariivirga litoralis TaxID=2650924 RepID=UPI0018C4C0C4